MITSRALAPAAIGRVLRADQPWPALDHVDQEPLQPRQVTNELAWLTPDTPIPSPQIVFPPAFGPWEQAWALIFTTGAITRVPLGVAALAGES